MKDSTTLTSIRSWVEDRFPNRQMQVRQRGRDVYISELVPINEAVVEEKLVRVRTLGSGQFGLSYFRHTGRWEDIEVLSGGLYACLRYLQEDPMGLFWTAIEENP